MKAKDLKNSILQMAVEGKLVPQDPNDEPASVLLERIREEKQRLIAEGKAKFPKGGESIIYTGSDGSPYEKRVDAKGSVLSEKCIADEVPFEELPEGWAWARFQTLCFGSFTGPFGSALHKSDYVAGGIPVVNPANINEGSIIPTNTISEETSERLSSYTLRAGDFIIGRRGEMGRAAIVSDAEDGWLCGTGCFFAHTSRAIEKLFWKTLFSSLAITNQLKSRAVGTTMKNLNLAILDSLILPLPPLAEQHRIVEHVSELMPLVEEYGKLEDAREALDAALPGRLRKSVLQMAVQGKLVPQDPADEPASVLLERIREQRRKMIAEKKMKAPKGGESVIFRGSDGRRYEKRIDAKGGESEPICIEDEILFEIPDSWEWVRLSTVLQLSSGLGYKKDNLSVKGEHMVRVLRGGNIGEDDEPLIKDNDVLISAEFVDDSLLLRDGQIITPAVTSLENVGKAAIVRNADGETVCGGFVFYLTPYLKSICHSEYLHRYLASPGHIAFCKSVVKKSGQAFYNLSKASLNSALIAIPPLAEQHRIVERVNELMPLITNQ